MENLESRTNQESPEEKFFRLGVKVEEVVKIKPESNPTQIDLRRLDFPDDSAGFWEIEPTRFAKYVSEAVEGFNSYENIFKEHFAGQPIIDVGAGEKMDGYIFAQKMGASAYLAIEPRYPKSLAIDMRNNAESLTIPFAIIGVDGLSALRDIEDNSSNIMTLGTDNIVIKREEYAQLVRREVERIIGSDKVFLGVDTVFSPHRDHESATYYVNLGVSETLEILKKKGKI